MKKLGLLLLSFITIALISLVWFFFNILPISSNKTPKRFMVNPGETASQIGNNLQKENLIKSALAFRIYSQVSQAARNIKPGSYELTSNLWTPQIITKLLEGPTEVWVTLPEGLRKEEMSNKFISSLNLTGQEAEDFRTQFLNLTKDKEGYLFPDTYLVPIDSSVSQIVSLLEDNFKKRVNFPVTYNNIILASILERETKTDDERPVVAGILLKRLDAGWPLQADATIQYVVGTQDNFWPSVTPSDLQIDSPYNTYTNQGLPPTPICNPGLSSIKAAINPTSSNYWYYLHDKEGNIHYATTIDEQNANIAKYL